MNVKLIFIHIAECHPGLGSETAEVPGIWVDEFDEAADRGRRSAHGRPSPEGTVPGGPQATCNVRRRRRLSAGGPRNSMSPEKSSHLDCERADGTRAYASYLKIFP